MLQDLLRAHSTFLLHHAASLSALFVRTKRPKFVNLLSRYWDLFLSTWNVMLHGNPATSVFAGIKIAASGELGIGVGEEERGSGEREVLEGFVERTEGLVDLVVSKFGPSDEEVDAGSLNKDKAPEGDSVTKWLGTGDEPGAEDGAVFLGVGALSRKSLLDVTYWMEDLYSWGEEAYGVRDNPSSTRPARRPRKQGANVKAVGSQPKNATEEPAVADPKQPDGKDPSTATAHQASPEGAADEGGMNRFMNYLKLGYGTHWTLGGHGASEEAKQDSAAEGHTSNKEATDTAARRQPVVPDSSTGGFLIGLVGGVEETDSSSPVKDPDDPESGTEEDEYNSRVLVRTVNVELDSKNRPEREMSVDLTIREGETKVTARTNRKDSVTDPDSHRDHNRTQKLRVVVYVNRPFIYTFLFESRTDCLAWDSFYRSLHHMLAPLRKPLGASASYRPGRPDVGPAAATIFDLVWDPRTLTIHSTIPNIPDPLQTAQQQGEPSSAAAAAGPQRPPPWSRAEAVNTHNQILNTYIATRDGLVAGRDGYRHPELERTAKTNRGWWVVWTRILKKDPDAAGGSVNVSGSTTPRGPADDAVQLPGERPVSSSDEDDPSPLAPPSSSGPEGEERPGPSPGPGPDTRNDSQPTTTTTTTTTTDASQQSTPTARVVKEVFLVRRAGEYLRRRRRRGTTGGGGGGGFMSLGGVLGDGGDGGGSGGGVDPGGWTDGTEGIGVDTRRYIEGLLSLAR